MLEYLKKEANKTLTENGAVTYSTTTSNCLDLFATIGALRNTSDQDIIDRFTKAYIEDPLLTMKIIFYGRDVRGGLGERKVFRTIIKYMAEHNYDSIRKNIHNIPEFGRYDDLLMLLDTKYESDMIVLIKEQLNKDLKSKDDISLLGKWLPSINASNNETVNNGKRIAKLLNMKYVDYRKTLSLLRKRINILENYLRTKSYTFDYSKQPSKAMYKYKKAFIRNDEDRYTKFLESVNKGEKILHTGTLYPYDIVEEIYNKGHIMTDLERESINTTWNSLEDFTNNENALVVMDGSGSMLSGKPMAISIAMSLAIYFAERNKGVFYNHFITFSENPRLVEIKGNDIINKVQYCKRYNEVANTNIQKVFELILNTAVKNNVPQNELPNTIYVVSDMEWDWCSSDASLTNFEYAKKIFEEQGYKLPTLVFWNVQSRNQQQPVTKDETGTLLVSGCSQRIFSMVITNNLNPYAFMLETLNNERYNCIIV